MTKNKILIIVGIATIIICIFFAVILAQPKTNELLRFAIFPSDGYDSSYYFVLYEDATYKCYFGERNTDDIHAEKFMHKIRKSKKTKLKEYEFVGLLYLVNGLIASDFASSGLTCDDWYYVTLLYNEIEFKDVYQHIESKFLEQLSDELVWLSPMKIKGYSKVPGIAPQRVLNWFSCW